MRYRLHEEDLRAFAEQGIDVSDLRDYSPAETPSDFIERFGDQTVPLEERLHQLYNYAHMSHTNGRWVERESYTKILRLLLDTAELTAVQHKYLTTELVWSTDWTTRSMHPLVPFRDLCVLFSAVAPIYFEGLRDAERRVLDRKLEQRERAWTRA